MMQKKKILSFGIPATAFLAAAGLLFTGSAVGSTRAALNIYSDEYQTSLEIPELDVALEKKQESGAYGAVEGDRLLSDVGEAGAEAVIGKHYDEALRVVNTGELDSYVRVRVYRLWVDEEGKPVQTLAPELIALDLAEGSGWAIGEESADSEEMTVLYYMNPLAPGEATPDFMTGYHISYDVLKKVNEKGYAYADSPSFRLEVEVDAVQAVGGSEAIMSAWGRSMTVDENGRLSFGGYRGSLWDMEWDVSGNEAVVNATEENGNQ